MIEARAGAWVLVVSCLCLEESIESPARSGIGPARSYMGLQLPGSVQMAFNFGDVHPLSCSWAFTMAVIGGAMEEPSHAGETCTSVVNFPLPRRSCVRTINLFSFRSKL